MASVGDIEIDMSSLNATIQGLVETESKMKMALELVCDTASKKMEEWAKDNAKWEDRTTLARKGLTGKGYWEDQKNLVCAVMHTMEYGIWLELAHEKKYAILEQSIEQYKDDLIRQYKKIVGDV